MNPYDFHATLCAALERTRWRWRRPFRRHRHALRLSSPVVELRDANGLTWQWTADHSDEHGHAFTRRQAKEIRDVLVQAMRVDVQRMEADVLAQIRQWRPY